MVGNIESLKDIKDIVDSGGKVYLNSLIYEVQKFKDGSYNIVCTSNGYTIGLTWNDGITLNGKIENFFTK